MASENTIHPVERPKFMVSCCTAGRLHLVNRVVAMFLLQRPGNYEAEMIVVNNDPGVMFQLDPLYLDCGISFANVGGGLLGARNHALRFRHWPGDWGVTWDDDDVHLPGRLLQASRVIRSLPKPVAIMNKQHLTCNKHRTPRIEFRWCGGQLVYPRDPLIATGGYPDWSKNAGGGLFGSDDQHIWSVCGNATFSEHPEFFYEWHGIRQHASGSTQEAYEQTIAGNREKYAPNGRFVIRPDFPAAIQAILDVASTIRGAPDHHKSVEVPDRFRACVP